MRALNSQQKSNLHRTGQNARAARAGVQTR